MNLAGRSAFVTGGGTGIGAALALALAEQGPEVPIAGRRGGPLEEIAERADRTRWAPHGVQGGADPSSAPAPPRHAPPAPVPGPARDAPSLPDLRIACLTFG